MDDLCKSDDLFTFGNEDLSHITDHMFIKMWMTIQFNETDPLIMAENSITQLHELIKLNKKNINVILETMESETAQIFTEEGWITKPVDEMVDMVVKTRAGQLKHFKHLVGL